MVNITDHFKPEEFGCIGSFDGMDAQLLEWIAKARWFIDAPMHINSGKRTEEHNKEVGGSATSSHLKGMAADIRSLTSKDRYTIIKAFMLAGLPIEILEQIKAFEKETGPISIPRIGVGETFIHVDVDPDKTQDVIWLYPHG